MNTARKISFDEACRRYVHRFTINHVPTWAGSVNPNGKYCAPQFRSDREWYDNTKFKGETGWIGRGSDCFTTNQTWPLGQWLDRPFI
jgi:hypothetical protein